MKISLISILLGLTLIVSGSAQAWTLDEERVVDKKYPGSINQFLCRVALVIGSDEKSVENEEEDEEPDCD